MNDASCSLDRSLRNLMLSIGKVSGDAYQPCQWEVNFVDDTHITLRCVSVDKILSAEKFLATKFFSGFVGEVSAACVPEKAGPNERWQVIYGTRSACLMTLG